MKIRGKYKGNKNIELNEDINLPLNSEVLFTIEEIKPENDTTLIKSTNKQNNLTKDHPLQEIGKNAIHLGSSDLSENYHEILYGIESKDG